MPNAPQRIWYHVTRANWGTKMVLEPLVPNALRESKRPRVCFSPSVRQCLVALIGLGKDVKTSDVVLEFFPQSALVVYATRAKLVKANVADFKYTHEHVSFEPIKVTRVGWLDLRLMRKHARLQVVTRRPKPYDADELYFLQDWLKIQHQFVRAIDENLPKIA